jgi:hypothetical protein
MAVAGPLITGSSLLLQATEAHVPDAMASKRSARGTHSFGISSLLL